MTILNGKRLCRIHSPPDSRRNGNARKNDEPKGEQFTGDYTFQKEKEFQFSFFSTGPLEDLSIKFRVDRRDHLDFFFDMRRLSKTSDLGRGEMLTEATAAGRSLLLTLHRLPLRG